MAHGISAQGSGPALERMPRAGKILGVPPGYRREDVSDAARCVFPEDGNHFGKEFVAALVELHQVLEGGQVQQVRSSH